MSQGNTNLFAGASFDHNISAVPVLQSRYVPLARCGYFWLTLWLAFTFMTFGHLQAGESQNKAQATQPSPSNFRVSEERTSQVEDGAVPRSYPGTFEVQIQNSEPLAGSVVDITVGISFDVDLSSGDVIAFRGHPRYPLNIQVRSNAQSTYLDFDRNRGVGNFEARDVMLSSTALDADIILPRTAVELTKGNIPANTRLEFSINNLKLPDKAGQRLFLEPMVRFAGEREFLSLTGSSPVIRAGSLERLNLIGDSLTAPGEDINLRLRLEDKYGNLVDDRRLSLDLLVNGQFRNRVDVSKAYNLLPGIQFKFPGVYSLEIRTGGGGLRGTSNPIRVKPSSIDVLWLSIGDHTVQSGGTHVSKQLARSHLGIFDKSIVIGQSIETGNDSNNVMGFHTERHGFQINDQMGVQLGMALAEIPTDLRYFDPENLHLVQTAGPDSDYRWYGIAAANRGFRVGYTSYNHTFQELEKETPVYTGLTNPEGEYWLHSLAAGRTFVSVGEKILLLMNPYALSMTESRELSLEVVASNPVESLEFYKNGELLTEQVTGYNTENQFTLRLASENKPYSGLESKPRNRRDWIGYLATKGSTIDPIVFTSEDWQLRRAGNNRFDFFTRLHGGSRKMKFTLATPTPDTVLEIGLASVVEDAAWIPVDRFPQSVAAQHFLIPLEGLKQGSIRKFDAGGYWDYVEIGPALLPGEKTLSHQFVDSTPPKLGDHYYVRVTLSNGSYAYTSPVFVEKDANPQSQLSYDQPNKLLELEEE